MSEVNEEQAPTVRPMVTEEEAAEWKAKGGSVPRAIRAQVVAINRRKRLQKYKKTDKGIEQKANIDLFLEEFLKNGGNATQAALTVFNCTSIQSAATMGHSYLKKARGLGRIYMEKKGYGYGRMLDIAAKKMEEAKTPDWWDRLMKISEYEDFTSKKGDAPNIVNVIQAHKQYASDYIEGEEAEDEENIGELEEEVEEEMPEPEAPKEPMPKGKLKPL